MAKEEEKNHCRMCGEFIYVQASKCKECGSFQDWRRYLNLGNTTLALLVALLSVVSITGPHLYRLARGAYSAVEVSSYHFSPDGVSVVLRNSGTKPGYLHIAQIEVIDTEAIAPTFNLDLAKRSPSRIVTGGGLVEIFLTIKKNWLRSNVASYLTNPEKRTRFEDGRLKMTLYIELRQFDGSTTVYKHTNQFKYLYNNLVP